jgi:hypothetical protein
MNAFSALTKVLTSFCLFIAVVGFGFVGSAAADAAASPKCNQVTDYKVASPRIILLYCADGIPPGENVLKFTIFSLDPTAIQT